MPVSDSQSPLLGAIADLYRAAFPASERKPAAFLADAARRSDYAVLAAVAEAGDLAAMAVVYRSPDHPFALLEYMAVAERRRSGGIGTALFEAVVAATGRALLIEVESERPDESGAELRRRRIEFYRRHGCRTIAGVDYRMPQVACEPPPPMVLLEHGWEGAAIPGATLAAWLADLYAGAYARPNDDPWLGEMRRALGASVPLE